MNATHTIVKNCLANLTNDVLNRPYIDSMIQYVDSSETSEFLKPSGRQHYRLLGHISSILNDGIISDIGTNKGSSAVAFATNSRNNVHSFDVQNNRTCSEIPINCKFHLHNLLENDEYHQILINSQIVLIDVNNANWVHDGILEQQFHDLLQRIGFTGVAIYDDINLTDGTRNFWKGITCEKTDITNLGHGDWNAGTGVVYYN